MWGHTLDPVKVGLFGFLSLLDLFLTWKLLRWGGGQVYESNPVASWWLDRYDWAGLVAFKGATVLVAVGLLAVVARYRPRAGGRALTFACAAAAAVVLYSSLLGAFLEAVPTDGGELRQNTAQGQSLEQHLALARSYGAQRQYLTEALVAERCTLPEAVELLLQADPSRLREWLRAARVFYPGYSDEECLAITLRNGVAHTVEADPAARERAVRRLEEEFASCYGRAAPEVSGVVRAPRP
jgi:hypothetical protein